jgi:hypothetical protein
VSRPRLLTFPDPVDEVSARLVAGGVVVMSIAYVATGWWWLLVLLAYGLVARVASGPTLSPLGLAVTRVLRPRLPIAPRPTPGPPKRFAQAVGVTFTLAAVVVRFGIGAVGASELLVAAIAVAATLESVVGFCLGCWMFGRLMRAGVIPETVCEDCADLSRRSRVAA